MVKPPAEHTLCEEFTDWCGNVIREGDIMVVGQANGSSSRMWLGEVVAIAFMERTWPSGHSHTYYKAKLQPVSFNAYSGWRHDWPTAFNHFTGQNEPTGERPRPTWIMTENMVKYGGNIPATT